MFGIGGRVVIVPALIFIAKMMPEKATGTSLAALLVPVGALGAWLGSGIALQLPARDPQRAFNVFLVGVAVHVWWAA